MTLVDVLDATLDEAVRCIGNTSCEYVASVVLGPPPEGCNMLTAYYASSQMRGALPGCIHTIDNTIVVQLTRCCAHDAQEDFDWVAEAREAACWHRDFWQLFTCLTCTIQDVLEPWVTSCDTIEIEASAPHEREGGCYSGYIYISYKTAPCCSDFA